MSYSALLDQDPSRFNDLALELFRHQARNNSVYEAYLKGIGCDPDHIRSYAEIPTLPISFFRTHRVITEQPILSEVPAKALEPSQNPDDSRQEELIFLSSGSTSETASRHWVPDPQLYTNTFLRGFNQVYGKPEDWTFLFLLPSYLERKGSSLIYMCEELVRRSQQPESGFFLYDHQDLIKRAQLSLSRCQPTMILGVSFALLDLAALKPVGLDQAVVVETGGMKGRRRELVREELHALLKAGLGVSTIHSEYGMTEMLSQAWSTANGRFQCPPWMKIRIRELNDPLSTAAPGAIGAIDVMDLANVHSCAFISTDDVGRQQADGHFEVLGRMDYSDIRGCNLLMA